MSRPKPIVIPIRLFFWVLIGGLWVWGVVAAFSGTESGLGGAIVLFILAAFFSAVMWASRHDNDHIDAPWYDEEPPPPTAGVPIPVPPPVGPPAPRHRAVGGGIVVGVVLLVLLAIHHDDSDTAVRTTALTPQQRYPIGRFPTWMEQTVMRPCEEKTTVTFCTCVMSYIEGHESADEFSNEAQFWDQSGGGARLTPTAREAAAGCPVL